jgi:site-specific DNA recombinase
MNAIELVRVSTPGQVDTFGIPAQRSANRATAARYGLNIIQTVELAGVSGAKVLTDPRFMELLRLIQSPNIGALVTKEFSRLMRPENLGDMNILQTLADTGTKLYLPDGPIDFKNKSEKLFGGMKALFAGYEREEIRDRSMRGKEEARLAGRFVGHPCAYGVEGDKRTGWRYTENASRVRAAFDAVLRGEINYDEFARMLGTTPPGAAAILRNPIYSGWMVYQRGAHDAEPLRVQVIDAPLISEEAFSMAQGILSRKRDAHRRNSEKGWALYNGFVFCDRCGSIMSPARTKGRGGKRRFGYYVCQGRRKRKACDQPAIPANVLEENIDTLLSEYLLSPEYVAHIARGLEDQSDGSAAARLAELEQEKISTDAKRVRVLDLYVDGAIDKPTRDERLAKLAGEVKGIAEDIERLQALQVPNITQDQLVEIFTVFAQWRNLSREDRRSLLEVTIPRFRVDSGSVVSFYRLLDGAVCDKKSGSIPTFLSANRGNYEPRGGHWFRIS